MTDMDMDMRRRLRSAIEDFVVAERKLSNADGILTGPSDERRRGGEALIARLVDEFFLLDIEVSR